MRLKLIISLFFIFSNYQNFAQISFAPERNRIFEIWKEKNGLYFNLYSNGFFKNNEYFLKTVSGYTLFGIQNIPSLLFKPNKYFFAQGGIYLKKDFGTDGFVKIAPYYLFSLNKNDFSLNFGNYESNVNHRLYDPIFANEQLMKNYLEEGISLKVKKKKIYSELWINWEKQQYWLSDFNEKFTLGNNTRLPIYQNKGLKIVVPFQFLAMHSGGQIDTAGLPTSTIINSAIGLELSKTFRKKSGINYISAHVNYLIYKDISENAGLPYTNGNGIYANVNFGFLKNFKASLGYWQAHHFIAPKGDILYQSVSYNPQNLAELEPERRIVQLGFAYQKQIGKDINLQVLAQPFYDFQNQRVDYSYSLFLTFQPNILLTKRTN
ncbi:MAG TPA: hypothetical protein PKX92_09440 [Edaphocola sp.]|nr:hypothetical protein [Edaphocola sp.]